jgi:hypothetical protein
MSFDLFLQRFEGGAEAPADRGDVLRVLRKYSSADADDFGFYLIDFADGGSADFSAAGLESAAPFSGCAFHLRGLSPTVVRFVYEIAVAGDMAILNAQGRDTVESPTAIYVAEPQLSHLSEGLGEHPRLVTSADELGEALGAGFLAWDQYRDQIRGSGNGGT